MNSYCKSWFARLRFSLLFHMKDGPEKLILWNPDPCDLYAVFPSTISVAVSHYDTQTENDLLNDTWNTLNLCICSCLEYGWLTTAKTSLLLISSLLRLFPTTAMCRPDKRLCDDPLSCLTLFTFKDDFSPWDVSLTSRTSFCAIPWVIAASMAFLKVKSADNNFH